MNQLDKFVQKNEEHKELKKEDSEGGLGLLIILTLVLVSSIAINYFFFNTDEVSAKISSSSGKLNMNSQALSELEIIRWLAIAASLMLVYLVFQFVLLSQALKCIAKNQSFDLEKNAFLSKAHAHESLGEFDELYQLAYQRCEKFPLDLNGHWFVAMAHFKKKEWGKALTAFNELKQIDSVWEKYSIEDYLSEVKENLKGPIGGNSNKN